MESEKKNVSLTPELIFNILTDKLHNFYSFKQLKEKYNMGETKLSNIVKKYKETFINLKGEREKPKRVPRKVKQKITTGSFEEYINSLESNNKAITFMDSEASQLSVS